MSQNDRLCPDCKSTLKTVLLSELIGGQKEQGMGLFPAARAMFEYFDFYVCVGCGRTLVYAGSEARRSPRKSLKPNRER